MADETTGMKAHVSTMLTDSGLSIPLRARDFKASGRLNRGCKTTNPLFYGLSVLTALAVTSSCNEE